jgi:hypothetical protein
VHATFKAEECASFLRMYIPNYREQTRSVHIFTYVVQLQQETQAVPGLGHGLASECSRCVQCCVNFFCFQHVGPHDVFPTV